jgi:hypothetical protein
MKINNGVDHIAMKKNMEKGIIKNISDEVAHVMKSSFDVDFESPTFGRICIEKLKNNSNLKNIPLFFEDFERVRDVYITVKDPDHLCLDQNSHLVLKFGDHKRIIHARFFWAILPKKMKQPYVAEYEDHFDRLSQLLLGVGKGVVAESYL